MKFLSRTSIITIAGAVALTGCVTPTKMVKTTIGAANMVGSGVKGLTDQNDPILTTTDYKIESKLTADTSSLIYAKLNLSDNNQLKNNQYAGYIVDLKGNRIEGVLWVNDSSASPWENQKSVRFVDLATFNADGETKLKWTKYKPKSLKEYGLFNHQFESIKYAENSSVGTSMIARNIFVKKVLDGKVNLYAHYETPPLIKVIGSAEEVREYERELQHKRDYPNIIVRNAKGKFKKSTDIDINGMLADCPAVLDKYQSGAYGFQPSKSGKKGIGGFVSRVVDANRASFAGRLIPVFDDYNTECS